MKVEDIKETIGLNISQKLEDNLAGSLCEMAELMMN